MIVKILKSVVLYLALSLAITAQSQSLRDQVETKITQLEKAIKKAERKKLNVEKEKMTLQTAKVFLRYSDWDEANIDQNKKQFRLIATYRRNKVDKQGRNIDDVVNYLPTFNREQTIGILDKALANIKALKNKTLKRPAYRTVDFTKLKIKNVDGADMVVEKVKGKEIPTFFHAYTFKPEFVLSDIYDEDSAPIDLKKYHGHSPDLYLTNGYIKEDGSLKGGFKWGLKSKIEETNRISKVFLDHRQVPNHIKRQNLDKKNDTKSVYAGGRLFVSYDIDNPDIQSSLETILNTAIPEYNKVATSKLGYLLANEPHFATIEKEYFTPNTTGNQQKKCDKSPTCNNNLISYYTIKKFEAYLKDLYGDSSVGLLKLNKNWFGNNTANYLTSYAAISGTYEANKVANYAIDFPIKNSEVGTPKAYDWFTFNNQRVTHWFQSLHDIIKKHDAKARTHIKLIPLFFSSKETRDAGLDFEALQEIQEMIGNDADTNQELMNGKHERWRDRYNFNWAEMAMDFDFLSSVKPNAINYNSENHYISTNQFRDLYLTPTYVRSAFWLAYTLGEDISQIWYWPRETDASIRKSSIGKDNGYAASLIHQPAIVNEVGNIFYDLNAYASDMYKIQNSIKSIRVFHSETTAKNVVGHMEHTLDVYEKLFFDGMQVGFATERIIKKQDNKNWDVVVVYNTPFVTNAEKQALQTYLNHGGTIILDDKSLKKNQYGVAHTFRLNTNAGGKIIKSSDLDEIRKKALETVKNNNHLPKVVVQEDKTVDTRGCFWRTIEKKQGTHVVSVVNTGKENTTITISLDGNSAVKIKNLLDGTVLNSKIELKPSETLLLNVSNK